MKKLKMSCMWISIICSWWLILFPEMVFCSGMCAVYLSEEYDGEGFGNDTDYSRDERIEMNREALSELLFRADSEQIKYKSILWEVISQKVNDAKE